MQVKIMELESSFLFPSFLGKCTAFFLQTVRKQTKAGEKRIWSCNEYDTLLCRSSCFLIPDCTSKKKVFITTGARQ